MQDDLLFYNAAIVSEEDIPEPYGIYAEFLYLKRDNNEILCRLALTGIVNTESTKETYKFKRVYTVEFIRDCDTKPEEYIAYNEKEISNQLLEMFGDEYDNDLEFNDELKTIVSKIVNIN